MADVVIDVGGNSSTVQVVTPQQVEVQVPVPEQGDTILLPGNGGENASSPEIRVYNETPAGLINGANATFTSAHAFRPATLEIYIECVKLRLLDDYQILSSTTFQLTFSPEAGERIYINYIRS